MFGHREEHSGLKGSFLTLLSGLFHVLLFPQFSYSFLAWFALVPLFLALNRKKLFSSFLLGMLFGMISFLGILHWLYPTVIHYFQRPPLFGALFLLLGILLPAGIIYGLFALSYSYIHLRAKKICWVAIPSLWVSVEWLRSHPLTGIPPWELLGHSQYEILPLIQISDITGVYGISFMIVAVNYLLARIMIHSLETKRFKFAEVIDFQFIFTSILLSIFLLYGYHRINSFKSPYIGKTLHVSVIQGNIKSRYRWKNIYYGRNLGKYLKMTNEALKNQTDLIVWPENAVDFYLERESYYLTLIQNLLTQTNAYLVLGGPRYEEREEKDKAFYNSSYLFSPISGISGVYDKIRLLPMSEYNPLEMINLYNAATRFPSKFSPGDKLSVFEIPKGKFSITICYEIIYPDLIRKFVNRGAQFLINLSNDSWLGSGPGPYQHLSIALFRAVENRTYLVRATSTGISAIIDPLGRIIRASSLFESSILQEDIRLKTETTLYTEWGELFAYLCILTTLISLIYSVCLKRNSE